MTLALTFTPINSGYTSEVDEGVIQIPLEGGMSRKRQDIYFPGNTVNAQWLLTKEEYTRFMGFFTSELRYASQPFLVDLITDVGVPTTHKVSTIGGMPKLVRQSGNGYWVSCTLQCENNPTYTGLIAYQLSGTEGRIIFSNLKQKISTSDTVRIIDSSGIHPTDDTSVNLDGTYTITSTVGFNVLVIDNPTVINSDWNKLLTLGDYGNAGNGDVVSTVTRVPT